MVKLIKTTLKTIFLSFVFFGSGIMLINITKSWSGTDGLTAENNDTLTAEKWNSLVAKTNNTGWTIVEATDTSDFNHNCERRVQCKYNPDGSPRSRYFTQVGYKSIITYWSSVYLQVSSTNKGAFTANSQGPNRTLLKLEKKCN